MHSPEWFLRIVLVGVVLGAAAVGALVLARRWWPEADSMSPGCWWGFPYVFGAVLCVLGLVVPEPQWREPIPGAGQPFTTIIALAGGGLIFSGAIIHVVLWRLGALTGSREERLWPKLAVGLALATVVVQFLEHRGVNVGLWLLLLCGSLLVVVVLLCVVFWYLQVRHSSGARMARLVADGRADEAIEIAQDIPAEKRDPYVHFNLAAAYCETGDIERAEELFSQLLSRPDLPDQLRKLSDGWMQKIAQEKARKGTCGPPDAAQQPPFVGNE